MKQLLITLYKAEKSHVLTNNFWCFKPESSTEEKKEIKKIDKG